MVFSPYFSVDVDECTTTPCKNGAACINLPGSYRCDCNSGYTGKHCESGLNPPSLCVISLKLQKKIESYKRGKFLKKLWCCFGGEYNEII